MTKSEKLLKILEIIGTKDRVVVHLEQVLSKTAVRFSVDINKLKKVVEADEIMRRAVDATAEDFAHEELDAGLHFFGSKAGLAFYKKMSPFYGKLTEQASKYMAEKLKELSPELRPK